MTTSLRASVELVARLKARRGEMEAVILTRAGAIQDPAEIVDPAYAEGFGAALGAALDYGFAGIERGEGHFSPIPVAVLSQARLAARNGVPLDAVLRRYFAGYTFFSTCLIEEAELDDSTGPANLGRLLRVGAEIFDRLVVAVSREYRRAGLEDRHETTGRRRRRLVEELLAGQRAEATELRYRFDAWHLGLIGVGPSAGESVDSLARSLGVRHLLVEQDGETVWGWLGSDRPFERERLDPPGGLRPSPGVRLAVGEPARGISGWRLTHRQAASALTVSGREPAPLVRYREVALLAAAHRDALLRASLRQIFLDPLASERDGGATLRLTLDAYFNAGRNAAAAAAALGVSRQTVNSRLRTAEERLGRSLAGCAAELQTALRLGEPSKGQAD